MTVTKSEADGSHPASHYLVASDPQHPSTWHLRVRDASGAIDHRLLGAAWAALHEGYRGNTYQGPDKEAAIGKLLALYKSEGMQPPSAASERQQFDMTAGDAHVNVPLGSDAPRKKRRSPLLRHLLKSVKLHFAQHPALSSDQFSVMYRQALGHAGGSSKSAAEPSDWRLCADCAEGNYTDCICPACTEEDPDGNDRPVDDCLCQAILAEDDDQESPSAAREPGSPLRSSTGETFRLLLPMEFAEPPTWIPYLPKPGTFQHPSYGEISITAERNADFVRKFNAGVYQTQLPLDGEHQTKATGAMGWVRQLRQNLDGSVDARVDWTDRGRAMLAGERYQYVSPEWYDTWQDPVSGEPVQNVLIGGALTTRPFFKEGSLRPLVASETGFVLPTDAEMHPQSPVTPRSSRQESPMPEPTTTQLTEQEIKRFRELESELAEARAAKETSQRELEESRKASEAAQAEAKAAAERVTALETENRRKAFAEQASPWHGDTAKHVSILESLPSDELRQQYAEQQGANAAALAEAQKQAKLFTSVGITGAESADSPMGQLQAFAETIRANEPSLSRAEALARAIKANPSLYSSYSDEHTRDLAS